MFKLKYIYKNYLRKFLASNFIVRIIWLYIHFVFLSSKKSYKYLAPAFKAHEGKVYIFIFWHSRLMMMNLMPGAPKLLSVVISHHKDGEVIGKATKLFGKSVIWGSTRRGWAGVTKEIFRAFRKNTSVVITPDGPRGPAQQINSSLAKIASKTAVSIVPVSYGCRRKKVLNSWDKFIFPFPFNKLKFVYGSEIKVPKNLSDAEVTELNLMLKKNLDEICKIADNI